MSLEGGYDQASLGRSVVAVLQALRGRREDELIDRAAGAPLAAEVERAMVTAGNYWELA